jgi:hypothetical protein
MSFTSYTASSSLSILVRSDCTVLRSITKDIRVASSRRSLLKFDLGLVAKGRITSSYKRRLGHVILVASFSRWSLYEVPG